MTTTDVEPVLERLDRIARLFERAVAAMEHVTRTPATQTPPTTSPTAESLWDAQQTAKFLHCSVSRVYKAAEAGTLPCIHNGRSLRFKPSDIRAHVEKLRGGTAAVVRIR